MIQDKSIHPDSLAIVRAVDAMAPSGKAALALLAFCHTRLGGCVAHPEACAELEKLWAVMVSPSVTGSN
jgi:hypothetical protein